MWHLKRLLKNACVKLRNTRQTYTYIHSYAPAAVAVNPHLKERRVGCEHLSTAMTLLLCGCHVNPDFLVNMERIRPVLVL